MSYLFLDLTIGEAWFLALFASQMLLTLGWSVVFDLPCRTYVWEAHCILVEIDEL
jgi:hypothetical protein